MLYGSSRFWSGSRGLTRSHNVILPPPSHREHPSTIPGHVCRSPSPIQSAHVVIGTSVLSKIRIRRTPQAHIPTSKKLLDRFESSLLIAGYGRQPWMYSQSGDLSTTTPPGLGSAQSWPGPAQPDPARPRLGSGRVRQAQGIRGVGRRSVAGARELSHSRCM